MTTMLLLFGCILVCLTVVSKQRKYRMLLASIILAVVCTATGVFGGREGVLGGQAIVPNDLVEIVQYREARNMPMFQMGGYVFVADSKEVNGQTHPYFTATPIANFVKLESGLEHIPGIERLGRHTLGWMRTTKQEFERTGPLQPITSGAGIFVNSQEVKAMFALP